MSSAPSAMACDGGSRGAFRACPCRRGSATGGWARCARTRPARRPVADPWQGATAGCQRRAAGGGPPSPFPAAALSRRAARCGLPMACVVSAGAGDAGAAAEHMRQGERCARAERPPTTCDGDAWCRNDAQAPESLRLCSSVNSLNRSRSQVTVLRAEFGRNWRWIEASSLWQALRDVTSPWVASRLRLDCRQGPGRRADRLTEYRRVCGLCRTEIRCQRPWQDKSSTRRRGGRAASSGDVLATGRWPGGRKSSSGGSRSPCRRPLSGGDADRQSRRYDAAGAGGAGQC